MIKVIMHQRAKSEKDVGPIMDALRGLRNEAMKQPGYVTGETLVNTEDPCDILVISTWHTVEHLNAWDKSEARIKVAQRVDSLLAEPRTQGVYGYYLVREGKVWSTL